MLKQVGTYYPVYYCHCCGEELYSNLFDAVSLAECPDCGKELEIPEVNFLDVDEQSERWSEIRTNWPADSFETIDQQRARLRKQQRAKWSK